MVHHIAVECNAVADAAPDVRQRFSTMKSVQHERHRAPVAAARAPESGHGAVRKRFLDESRQEALARTSRRSRWSDAGERKKAHKLETLALLAGGVSANFANNTKFREFIDHISDGLIGVDRHRIPGACE